MIRRVFVEQAISEHPRVQRIIEHYPRADLHRIDRIGDVFEQVKKPHLIKRREQDLFLGIKRGKKLRQTPDNYGKPNRIHFGLTHIYNCLYECSYCYLQGYFHSPDIVYFINLEDYRDAIRQSVAEHRDSEEIWFHAGEYGDSLALADVFGDLPILWDAVAATPRARLELRTKSINIKSILKLAPLPNAIVSFTLMPQAIARAHERRTPSIAARINAIKTLVAANYPVAVHLDPVIATSDLLAAYAELIGSLAAAVDLSKLQYVTIGALRFSKRAFGEARRNYPQSRIFATRFINSFDDKLRYPRPIRLNMINQVKSICRRHGLCSSKIYTCMEDSGADQSGVISTSEIS